MKNKNPDPGNDDPLSLESLSRAIEAGSATQKSYLRFFGSQLGDYRPEVPELSLLRFSQIVKDGKDVEPELYIELMRRVLPLDRLRDLSADEIEWLTMAASWLYDYTILLHEFAEEQKGGFPHYAGSPIMPGSSGPFIGNILMRGNDPADFSQIETFGIEKGGAI